MTSVWLQTSSFMRRSQGKHKIKLMRAADCFVLPSLQENFGHAVVEAMQQGLPVVISKDVYTCDSIQQAGAGFVCSHDERDVFLALQRLARDNELRSEMAGAAMRLGKQFVPEVLSEKYTAFFVEMAQTASRGATAN